MLTPNNLALPSGCIQKNIEKKYFSKNFCLPCYTSPLNMTIRWAMTIIIGCNKVCLCVSSRIWTKGSPPDLALSCVPFAIPSSRSPPSRGLKAWCQQSPRWTGSMNRFSFQALFRSRQCRKTPNVCSLEQPAGGDFDAFHWLLLLFLPAVRDLAPESPTSWILQRSSGSVSSNTVEEMVLSVGDTEVKMRKSKKKKKRSSMIFITEERERTSTLDCRRVRQALQISRQERRKHEGKWRDCHCWVGAISVSL